jgi:hypothetical protein
MASNIRGTEWQHHFNSKIALARTMKNPPIVLCIGFETCCRAFIAGKAQDKIYWT